MDNRIGAGRQHQVLHQGDGTRIEIEEPFGTIGRWLISVETARADEAVHLRLLDRLVVALTPREANDLAEALKRAAGGR
ncbi:hypothetical protein [Bosea minatitlanensis]|uniref:Uncharacterized protein n=1 Tax=Bosea minatitlanensis TaxID=128782 RepID=A0ABW0EZX1_9HYPH|nr:hypothetical protein [Bosea minatitlanensis]MCT4491825.1 hypothetical protein [Bosea minatitlanensis]